MRTRTDKMLLVLTAVCVAGLAIVAGAISFAHMRELAADHGQTGWKSYAFPISVDGLEIVASLFLVAQRRAGRPTGWVPWVALIIGTAASLAANVAVGGADPIGKALAGWPALSMLVSVKLLFAMFDAQDSHRAVARDDQRTVPTVPDVAQSVRTADPDGVAEIETVPCHQVETRPSFETGPADVVGRAAEGIDGHNKPASPSSVGTVAHLIPAARTARTRLAREGRSLSRDNLADALRDSGHGVSNERASLLVKILKAERDTTTIGPLSTPTHPADPDKTENAA
ncbi:DUF2637 domain-containing protein [Asanoa siamensis]|uniref:DUF2637 domain-containing protein n=1 Tax=Asanoa siamensis TaxID=926357 RepID=A0ABQ4CKR4_9ACTN|nr:DUF2637 domain-containing protein [Asanoa siamensis]GIF71880.1 hypothetical protein Asi02nite_13980 [Asanoa siamensis]